ncbi:hypothetical protein A7985_07530 [Pseudoalteromonas luteoviolacea]|uniref:DUF2846 domain-containing protein n=1 Tax=Pseudoalteromonas luteoviolacea TaxID=43657 RepID=A0A1C0TWT1_9GAMM|nr:DUF2057 domain-containing protein [Pseudoalteromonas luteoviolacea]OCQ23782.1 hypothetical protein A7985_07530 [Pseudoalteromonas luteoviolacea]
MRKILLFTIFTLLSGCAATSIEQISANPEKAIIIAYSDSLGSVLVPLASSTRTRIEVVNGKKVSDFFNSTETIELDQGKHNLIVSCHYIQGAINVSHKTEHVINVQKGKKYVFKAVLDREFGCTSKYDVI